MSSFELRRSNGPTSSQWNSAPRTACFSIQPLNRWAASVLALLALVTTLILLPAVPAAFGQAPSFADQVDVRVVNVETVVTDKAGNRIFGLGPEDFRLRVDGEEVPIDYFSEVRGGEVLADIGHDPSADNGTSPIMEGQTRGTSYLVFLDDYFVVKTDRQRVLDALVDQLSFLGPEDRMAVVAWDGDRLEMLSSWSSSERELTRAFQEAAVRPARGLERLAFERSVRSSPLRVSQRYSVAGRRFDIEERSYARRVAQELDDLVAAASATLRSFGGPDGRKVMLLVSGGWPFTPADFIAGNSFDAAIEHTPGNGFERGPDLYQPLIETANLVGYTLYPIDAVGLGRTAGNDASFGSPSRYPYTSSQFFREWEQHTSLRYLAEHTGGKALINGQRSQPIELVHQDTRSFYWLGFAPGREFDGEAHRIEVEVIDRGLRARARTGFRDLSIQQEVAMAVESALLFGEAASHGELQIAIGTPRRLKWGKVEVPIRIAIPAGKIAMLPIDADYLGARVSLRVAAMDQRGNRSDIPDISIELRRSRDAAAGDSVVYEITLKMRSQDQELIVALYDPTTGELYSTQAALSL